MVQQREPHWEPLRVLQREPGRGDQKPPQKDRRLEHWKEPQTQPPMAGWKAAQWVPGRALLRETQMEPLTDSGWGHLMDPTMASCWDQSREHWRGPLRDQRSDSRWATQKDPGRDCWTQ